MSTLGLAIPTMPPMVPQRLRKEVSPLFVKVVGRQGMNFYRLIDGKRTIQDIARLVGKSDREVMQVMKQFQRAGYVTVEISKGMSTMERIACIPTMIIAHADLGL
jgi:hypothetical protein